jgi:hypothetical protein
MTEWVKQEPGTPEEGTPVSGGTATWTKKESGTPVSDPAVEGSEVTWTKKGSGSVTTSSQESEKVTSWEKPDGSITSVLSAEDLEWTEEGRPVNPAAPTTGYNTDFKANETWDGTYWKIIGGEWSTDTRPDTTLLAPGSFGFNTDEGMGQETWDGKRWVD